jgi:hypothetical protein
MVDFHVIIQEVCSWIILGNVFVDFTKAPIYDLSTRSMTFYKQVTLTYDLSTRSVTLDKQEALIYDPSTWSVTFYKHMRH